MFLDRRNAIGKITADSQVVFVDEGSRDQAWQSITQQRQRDSRIRGIKLSANRGHQTALIAVLFAADGDAIASIDADLQDDISAMEVMVEAYASGCDVV